MNSKVVQLIRTGPGYYLLLHEDGSLRRGTINTKWDGQVETYEMATWPVPYLDVARQS